MLEPHTLPRWVLALALLVPTVNARAQTTETTLAPIDVIGTTPLLGSGVDRAKVPAATSVLNSEDIRRDGTPDALRALNDQVPGVNLDNAAGNPFQPNLFYHGFQASPLQGTEQGLAVYVNGVRFNEAFGDTVNWDLIPDIAIDDLNVVGSSPVFGLNALGGALSVQLKNGFTYRGGEVTVFGGSFGRVQGEVQYGIQRDNIAAYVAADVIHEGGWRDLQSSDLYNIYADLGWRSDVAELHVSVTGAETTLNGPGSAPVQLLAADPAAQFTAPNLIANKYAQVNATASVEIDDTTSLQGVAYYSNFRQNVLNGNASNLSPCNDGSGLLCESPGQPATSRGGALIPANILGSRNGSQLSEVDMQTTNTDGDGVSAQVTNKDDLFGLHNQLILGASFDGANILFDGSALEGGLTPDTRVFVGPGIPIDLADDSTGPVRVAITDRYYGFFLTDTLDITPRLSVTAAGRFNAAQIDLSDQIGTALDGNHVYNRFNPSLGATYKITPSISVYGSYAESNRAPTPAELSCGDAAAPCSLANFFVGDPNLKQVIAHTFEIGLRGHAHVSDTGTLDWNLGLFHTNLDDDILFVNSVTLGRAFFQNVGSTRRQGIDAGLSYKDERWNAFVGYSYVDATFQTGFVESGGSNPAADANGNVTINSGDRLPGIPAHRIKLGASFKATDAWTIGGTARAESGQYLFGDEANLTPRLPAYFTLNLNTSYQLTPNVQLFGLIENVNNAKYYQYGTFAPTSSVVLVQAPNATNPRSYNLAAPIGGFGGVRVTF